MESKTPSSQSGFAFFCWLAKLAGLGLIFEHARSLSRQRNGSAVTSMIFVNELAPSRWFQAVNGQMNVNQLI
jgi:hypothetical protein